ncbi:hypothetical protein [Chitinophaga sp. YR573]|uniref:hypothetical protein n=1 Tax=Chitinophaga sp. YR573 TaxID=1881040 RepID=UPI00115F9329|nr:hypothetical protein [Chitinophaga sp. YR573]
MQAITRLLCGIGLMGLFSCKKEKSSETIYEVCGYAPYTTESTFDYVYVSNTQDTLAYTLIVTGDTLINGDRFSILNNGYTSQYIRCDNGRYFLFEFGISVPGYERPDGVRLFLYDNKSVGATWADTITAVASGQPQIGLLQYTILQQGGFRTVMGHEYANVIGVRQDASVLIDSTVHLLGTIATYYYAQDVGYIQAIAPEYTVSLKNYNVK